MYPAPYPVPGGSGLDMEMQTHMPGLSRAGKRKSEAVERNPAVLLAEARVTQVCAQMTRI